METCQAWCTSSCCFVDGDLKVVLGEGRESVLWQREQRVQGPGAGVSERLEQARGVRKERRAEVEEQMWGLVGGWKLRSEKTRREE